MKATVHDATHERPTMRFGTLPRRSVASVLLLGAGLIASPARAGPVEIAQGDGTVNGAMSALADGVAKGFAALGREVPFHRIAVPYFEEAGEAAASQHVGRLVAELLSVELAERRPFVIVERERLKQVMREHRLAGLGIVDESTAAAFGKVLGAQSLISGTVSEAGPKYVVTVRQVEVESGRVLVSGKVEMDRAGLVALSSEAVVLRSRTGALFRSVVVPGWGQFYNREPVKGTLFLAGGLGTAGAAAGFFLASLGAKSDYESNTAEHVGQREVANDRVRVANVLLIAYGVVWAANLVDAYLSGSDSTTVELTASGTGVAFSF